MRGHPSKCWRIRGLGSWGLGSRGLGSRGLGSRGLGFRGVSKPQNPKSEEGQQIQWYLKSDGPLTPKKSASHPTDL